MAKTANCNITNKTINKFRLDLLQWYDKHQRVLPWRARGKEQADPYHVWLSEIMLQQTTVSAVKPYFEKFLMRWPSIDNLANATQDEVMSAWAGLGYYARARNLHKCAQIVSYDLEGVFPDTQDALKTLPGIGDYTSAAITAIAFNTPAVVIDGNIERIMARYFAITSPIPKSKTILKTHAAKFFDGFKERPGDLAQAMMDLGATICIPKTPRCVLCPVSKGCEGRAQGIANTLPRKLKKKPQPKRHGYIYWVTNDAGQVLMHKRPDSGLLGGMIAPPTSQWIPQSQNITHPPLLKNTKLEASKHSIFHTFTHFDLELKLIEACGIKLLSSECFWMDIDQITPDNFATVFKKALHIFLK